MRLCFGTFAQVLLHCSATQTTKVKMVNTLVQSVDDTCKLQSNSITPLLQCTANLPDSRSNGLGEVISKAQEADPTQIARYFAAKISPLLDKDMSKDAVRAIVAIIADDETIHGDTVVDVVGGITKKALLKQSKFTLPSFLAGVFLYTTTVDNRIGKEAAALVTVAFIHSASTTRRRKITDVVSNKKDSAANPPDDMIQIYLSNMRAQYDYIKTLIYRDQPKPFYSFYIPNHISHSSGSYRSHTICDITVKRLTNISNFLILDGLGGIGKSMMMRHLLLNAISEYHHFHHIPVFISLKDYDGSNLIDFAYAKMEVFNEDLTKTVFLDMLKAGYILFLFDGMDEMDSRRGTQFEYEIQMLTGKYDKNYYMISSRPYQTYIALSRFTVLKILPFTQQQSICLIDKLEYREDEPEFKRKFRSLLEGQLYNTHRSFIENPLLLTILLMTFEKFASIPTKMHVFYRKAFITLSEAHDATKVSYKRLYKSGLMPEGISDCFAEFCFHSYKDFKFEFTEEEFERYHNGLKVNDQTVRPADFAYDLCTNLCLMFLDGSKYQFTHRSFQEYFCALFFSKQKDQFIARLGHFFEKEQNRVRGDQTLRMLYDMIPDKVETHIFIPFLQRLFDDCDKENGYWTFLEKNHPHIGYSKGEVIEYWTNADHSFLFEFIMDLIDPKYSLNWDDLPKKNRFMIKAYGYVWVDENSRDLVDIAKMPKEYPWIDEQPEVVGWTYALKVSDIVTSRLCGDMHEVLNDDAFIAKSRYNAARQYLEDIKAKQQSRDDYLLALL